MGEDIGYLGEHALIRRISERMATTDKVAVGVGDDAAVIRVDDADVVVCTDAMVEGVHFRRHWSTAQQVGGKVAARNFSDIAAMGAVPVGFTLSMTLPADIDAQWVDDIVAGVNDECERAGAAFLGGDTTSGPAMVLVGSAVGSMGAATPVLRSGAKAGDVVAVHGRLGCAAAGLALLRRGMTMADDTCITAHQRPRPDYAAGRAAVGAATSMIDTSDGLIADLRHIAAMSSVDIDIRRGSVPVPMCVRAAADACDVDAWQWVLTGGDDHALIATFPPHKVLAGWHIIGAASAGSGHVRVDGQLWSSGGGYEHFGADHSRHLG